ncbi:MAG: ribosomal L7Ae/L30e/S12e/Gadd45 family protein [Clostridia bacterium]|nr:ribosomal L7Ae/L30e/S12e/Gadd45 family protein [Clostridia bacterium]
MNNSPLLSFLGITCKSGNLIFGMDNIKKYILKKRVKLILTAKDVSENSYSKIKNYSKSEIEILPLKITKEEIKNTLGKFSGVIAVKDDNFANKIKSLINNTSPR